MTASPTVIGSLFGGFGVFFSIWQLCLMQFSPFYIAYFLTVYFLSGGRGGRTGMAPLLITAAGLAAGFSVIFAVLSAPGFASSHDLLRGIRGLKHAAGLFILAAGALMMALSVLGRSDSRAYLPAILSPLVGASFAVAYSPCIPPALSKILNFSDMPGNSVKGIVMLFSYGIGVCAAATIAGAAVILLARYGQGRRTSRHSILPSIVSSLVFMIIGLLLVMGLMLPYKRFLVNIF
ncbi:MAG: hypothetical protein HY887_00395 [Deltaproteobacteria bacterium]|nr:hypothetical protein [Deltaproteobacteria bacterium]